MGWSLFWVKGLLFRMFVASIRTVNSTSLVTLAVSKAPLGFGAQMLYTC